jgi:phosphinothricin acetyltransferase
MTDTSLVPGIRRAHPADLTRITEIYNQAILHTVATFDTETKSIQAMVPWLAQHDDAHPAFVAVVSGKIESGGAAENIVVGWASLSRWSDRCAYSGTSEVSLYVDEAYQGKGIGRALMAQLMKEARVRPLHTLISRIATENIVSVHMHERFGFRHIGTMREVGVKFGRFLDVALYQLILPDPQPQAVE